jgi:hypothetical protein
MIPATKLAVMVLVCGTMMGQTFNELTTTGMSDVQIAIQSPDGAKTILTCASVLDDKGQWTPRVKNCKLENGGTLDDIINGMTDMHETERKQWQESTTHLQSLADRGIALAMEANKNAMQCSKDFKKFIRSAEAYAKGNRQ